MPLFLNTKIITCALQLSRAYEYFCEDSTTSKFKIKLSILNIKNNIITGSFGNFKIITKTNNTDLRLLESINKFKLNLNESLPFDLNVF